MEFHACCANTGTASGGCGGCWSCNPMISHRRSIRDRSGGHAGKGNCSPDHDSNVGRVCLGSRQFGCRRSPDLLLINIRSSLAPRQSLLSSYPLRPPMSSG
ncbi:hypothetical protein TNCV_4203851 [Trichonephila clavipes]|nr:hypothetical protein TNCV_4203851 [Trichonephila clavipes]